MPSLQLANELRARFGDLISEPKESRNEVTIQVGDPERIADVMAVAKKDFGFDFLKDISSVDNLGSDPRWTVVYHLYGLQHGCELRVKTDVSESKSELPSVTSIWAGANWHEREVYDMMGIRFRGHPDLRRILMWEGYPYHPLRKDFPLEGKPTDLPEVAFTRVAPLEGGPFVTSPGKKHAGYREPRSRAESSDSAPDLNQK